MLATSETLFFIIKWVGAAYLIYLGGRILYSSFFGEDSAESEEKTAPSSTLFRQGLLMQLANPQTILFFVALLPQFLDTQAAAPAQLLILGLISVFIEFPILFVYGWMAGKLSLIHI